MLLLSVPFKPGVRVRVERVTLQRRVAKFGVDCIKRSVGSALIELTIRQKLLPEKQIFYLAMFLFGLMVARVAKVTLEQMRKEIGPNIGLDFISYSLISVTSSIFLAKVWPSTGETAAYAAIVLIGLVMASVEVLAIEQVEKDLMDEALQRELSENLPIEEGKRED